MFRHILPVYFSDPFTHLFFLRKINSFYYDIIKQYILGQPQELAQALAKMSAVATLFNAVVSVILVAVIYNAVRPVLIKSHLLTITGKKKEQAA